MVDSQDSSNDESNIRDLDQTNKQLMNLDEMNFASDDDNEHDKTVGEEYKYSFMMEKTSQDPQ